MNKYFYDLHVHSCLSPCSDDDMTVNNIAGMAALKGLNIVALTDHNTTANCPAFFTACKKNGIVPIAGMELTTSEEIHIVCLFEKLADAMEFDVDVRTYRLKIKNKAEIFGNQLILDENDNVVGIEEFLLPPATALTLDEAFVLVRTHNGFCFPAHVDKTSNGIIGILGDLPESPIFNCFEFSHTADKEDLYLRFGKLKTMKCLTDSDAHYLWDISEAENYVMLDDEPYSSDRVRNQLFSFLRG